MNEDDRDNRTMKDVSHEAPTGVSASNVWRRGRKSETEQDDE
ncbi:hypothetical protein [Halegenticoccus tardaugens]|nr:hypothetical protein [Halegenticoccus tardaugens]